jgi:exosome complex component RRP4
MKTIVMPGDVIEQTAERIENTYSENGKLYSKIIGLYDSEKGSLVSLEGIWSPRVGDNVVGIIKSARNAVYEVDLSFFLRSILVGSKYDRHIHKPGDVIEATIKDVEDRKTVVLTAERVLHGGTVLNVKPTKVPRIIGKANTMVKQISDMTRCNIIVGKNGIVWIKGGNVALATAAIRQIEDEAHTSGLTERIKKMLEDGGGSMPEPVQEADKYGNAETPDNDMRRNGPHGSYNKDRNAEVKGYTAASDNTDIEIEK